MSSGLVRIAAATLLSGAVFVGAGVTPAFAAEGDDARDSDSSVQHNVNIKPQINIGTVNIAVAADEGDGNTTEADDNATAADDNANKCNGDANKGDGDATEGDDNANEANDNATAGDVPEQRNNSITNQWNVNI